MASLTCRPTGTAENNSQLNLPPHAA